MINYSRDDQIKIRVNEIKKLKKKKNEHYFNKIIIPLSNMHPEKFYIFPNELIKHFDQATDLSR